MRTAGAEIAEGDNMDRAAGRNHLARIALSRLTKECARKEPNRKGHNPPTRTRCSIQVACGSEAILGGESIWNVTAAAGAR